MIRALALLFCLFIALPARAALTVISLSKNQGLPTSHQMVVTTPGDCAAGSLIVVGVGMATTSTSYFTGASDQVSNSYVSPFDDHVDASATLQVEWSYSANTIDLPSGDTITATFSGSASAVVVEAACVTGGAPSSPLDVTSVAQNGAAVAATSATSISTGTLAQANEILFAMTVLGGNSGTFNCQGSWSKTVTQTSGGSPTGSLCTQIVSSTSSVAFAPTWATSQDWIDSMDTFKALVAVGRNGSLILMGDGQ